MQTVTFRFFFYFST
ncbi:pheST operon leader peptide PheM [Providencia stuartii]|uniref:pheST attenuator peptide n=2 Tax=Providencia TaxID=586 RepID=A0AAI9GLC8_PROST|nr:pheST operon leader peptide PheM [Providencia stuartii]QQO64314.1 pheST operon leader peptide PheM [Providencia manganoxydans]ELR5115301.1 pheST operon leader peptide PheM [Providencia stuartii]ELR5298968.1 pheST operon leader peptide PheM [Providencia stuartii]ELR5302661.1 pheST operon leader peptide PheM [Providencia stuartii]